jgi:hypothetical protein
MGVLMDNNNYYEAPYNDQEELEHLQVEIDELLKYDPNYDCTELSNFGEAISQCGDETQQIIRDYIEQKNWAKLGLKLYTISLEYQEASAEYYLTR